MDFIQIKRALSFPLFPNMTRGGPSCPEVLSKSTWWLSCKGTFCHLTSQCSATPAHDRQGLISFAGFSYQTHLTKAALNSNSTRYKSLNQRIRFQFFVSPLSILPKWYTLENLSFAKSMAVYNYSARLCYQDETRKSWVGFTFAITQVVSHCRAIHRLAQTSRGILWLFILADMCDRDGELVVKDKHIDQKAHL